MRESDQNMFAEDIIRQRPIPSTDRTAIDCEAIAFAPQTKHYYTLSEGTNRPLNFYERQ